MIMCFSFVASRRDGGFDGDREKTGAARSHRLHKEPERNAVCAAQAQPRLSFWMEAG
jgi:hypothetical protein